MSKKQSKDGKAAQDDAPAVEARPEFKFQVLQTLLAPALGRVARAVATRSTLPVLSNILVMALPEGRLRLVATNLEVAIVTYVSAKVEVAGGTTLPARTFVDLVGELPEQELLKFSFKLKTETTTIKYGDKKKSEMNLRGIPEVEFPMMPAHDILLAKVNADLLAKVIGKTVPSAATDEGRPILNGVLMHFKKDTITFASSDGYRLAVAHIKLSEPVCSSKEYSLIVPARVLSEVARLLGKDPTGVSIYVNANNSSIQFIGDSVEVMSQLIPGNFPDYKQIVPKKHDMQIVVPRKELIRKVKTAMVFARESANIVKLTAAEPDWLGLSAVSADSGDSDDGLEATLQGGPLVFALNGRYLLDALDALDFERVAIRGTTNASPFSIRGDGDDSGDLFIVMPMHLGERPVEKAEPSKPTDDGKSASAPAPAPAPAAAPAPVAS